MVLKYVNSDRGTDILVHKSYMFYREKQTEKKLFGNVLFLKKTKNADDFLLFDNKSDTKRILLFSTKNSLELMNNCLNWFCDGTFTCSPIPFKQLYTIHAVHYSNVIPSAYALLPDKKEDTYIQMFKALKSLNQNLNRKSIVMDFENAAMNAVKSEFPNTSINGCFFTYYNVFGATYKKQGYKKITYKILNLPYIFVCYLLLLLCPKTKL